MADHTENALPDYGRFFHLFAEHDRQPPFGQIAGNDQEEGCQRESGYERDIFVEKGRVLGKECIGNPGCLKQKGNGALILQDRAVQTTVHSDDGAGNIGCLIRG